MRILVTGSRNWTDEALIRAALRQQAVGTEGQPKVVVHGAARGADRIAHQIALEFGWTADPHRADWGRFGKAAGPIRNQEMVDLGADICLAFVMEGSVGTVDCIRRAEEAGIPVVRYEA